MNTDNQAIQTSIEDRFRKRAAAQDLGKPSSMKYRKAELEFFNGAMAALEAVFPNEQDPTLISEAVPLAWVFALVSGRSIVRNPGQHQ